MLSHVPGLQTYNSKQPFSLVNGVAVQIYRQASKLTTSPGSLRLHIEITCDYITLQIYMRPAKRRGWKSARLAPRAIRMALRISIPGILLNATVGTGGFLRPGRHPTGVCSTARISTLIVAVYNKHVMPQSVMQVTGEQYREG